MNLELTQCCNYDIKSSFEKNAEGTQVMKSTTLTLSQQTDDSKTKHSQSSFMQDVTCNKEHIYSFYCCSRSKFLGWWCGFWTDKGSINRADIWDGHLDWVTSLTIINHCCSGVSPVAAQNRLFNQTAILTGGFKLTGQTERHIQFKIFAKLKLSSLKFHQTNISFSYLDLRSNL